MEKKRSLSDIVEGSLHIRTVCQQADVLADVDAREHVENVQTLRCTGVTLVQPLFKTELQPGSELQARLGVSGCCSAEPVIALWCHLIQRSVLGDTDGVRIFHILQLGFLFCL